MHSIWNFFLKLQYLRWLILDYSSDLNIIELRALDFLTIPLGFMENLFKPFLCMNLSDACLPMS